MRRLNSDWTREIGWPRNSLASDLVNDFFNDFARAGSVPTNETSFTPTCEIRETKDHFVLSFDVPGIKKGDLKVELNGDQLSVSGERKSVADSLENGTVHRIERSYGRFQRIFTLPREVAADSVEAHHEDGVLTVVLAKANRAIGKTIDIQSGKTGFLSRLLGSKDSDNKDSTEVKIS
ncbi:MAG: Hsp20/alpha crystallin family protein [Bdellovibrionales bacterium]|nr:Hsp20/alpha crystallin family protein [Bdellovibrionales bacterium]